MLPPPSTAILHPLLSLLPASKASFLPTVLWRNSIQAGIGSTRPAEQRNQHSKNINTHQNVRSQREIKMDSMPIRSLSMHSSDAYKIPEPETKIQHVEHVNGNVNAPATGNHQEHLPKGLSPTDEERASHWFIGSIDCGTTSSRFLIFDGEGNPVSNHQIEFENIYPESG